MHYDIISAFIKSIRGSDPDAAVYWLARMVAGGEDPGIYQPAVWLFQHRKISGLANPNALFVGKCLF